MAYSLRSGSGGLRHSGGLGPSLREGGDVDPMATVANIVDAMLVFALGLMVALIISWNVDIGSVEEVEASEDYTEVSDIEDLADKLNSSGSSYSELGTVYQDPATGKMYMLTKDYDKSASEKGNSASKDN
ncbi:MAG: DUF2149 domain-containing protein [Coriobacteriales bacterium]|jgi:hypothetical protein